MLSTDSILPQVLGELDDPTEHRVRLTLRLMIAFVTVVYTLVAVAGYLQFSGAVCGTITESFEEINDPTFVTISQILVIISLGAGFPTALWPCRDAVCFLLFGGPPNAYQGGETTARVICVAVWASSCAMAMSSRDLDEVLELVGATVSSLVAFVLPFMCWANLKHREEVLWRRVALTAPGVCSLLGISFTLASAWIVARNSSLFDSERSGVTEREDMCERAASGHAGDGSSVNP